MIRWLMRTPAGQPIVDGLLLLQITGSPLPALVALAAPLVRDRLTIKGYHDA
ncbi:hypothetical protein [Sphingomonas morindae]|uniref:Uncharacterized protein n=1 Tax=Sphingomonas morindae TaxID=1541170 RepID=A0ABY4X9A3_9SPHN|nr:hypothetical protein [Sphingomonas morindae]USI73516.1 hypothetical protein LHA26_03270 [Sphingomonas morindae]